MMTRWHVKPNMPAHVNERGFGFSVSDEHVGLKPSEHKIGAKVLQPTYHVVESKLEAVNKQPRPLQYHKLSIDASLSSTCLGEAG